MILLFAIIGIIAYLFIPFLIVGFWKKRPRSAFILATFVLFFTIVSPSLIKAFQAMMIYGTGDPQLIAAGISEALAVGLMGLIFLGPILFLFQWFVLRRNKKKLTKVDADKIFS